MTVYTIKNGDVLRWPTIRECLKHHGLEENNQQKKSSNGPVRRYVKGEKELFIFELDPREYKMSGVREQFTKLTELKEPVKKDFYRSLRIFKDSDGKVGYKKRKSIGGLMRVETHGLRVWV